MLVSLFVGVHGPKIGVPSPHSLSGPGITINRSPVLLGCHVLQKEWDQPSTMVGVYPWSGSLAPQGNSGMLLQVIDGSREEDGDGLGTLKTLCSKAVALLF